MSVLLVNRRAKFDYEVLETYQAGLALSGRMVKLIRAKKVNLQGKYVVYQGGNLQIIGFGNEELTENVSLLLNRREVQEIRHKLEEKRITAVVLNIKQVGRWLKAEIGVVKGRKNYNKKQYKQDKDIARELDREAKMQNLR
jgi:SsrA-binding protein